MDRQFAFGYRNGVPMEKLFFNWNPNNDLADSLYYITLTTNAAKSHSFSKTGTAYR